MGDGVADLGIAHLLDLGGEHADLAGAEFGKIDHLWLEHGKPVNLVGRAGAHHLDQIALLDHAVDDADQNHNAEVRVIPAIDQHRLERCVAVALRGRKTLHNRLQHIGNTQTAFGGNRNRILRVNADHVLDVFLDPLGVCGGQVDLVQDRHDLVIGLDGLIDVGQRLRLDTLRGIDHQKRPFDRLHGPAHLIGKINVSGGVDQVEHIVLTVLGTILDAHRVRLDRDAAFAFDIHRVQKLLLHVPVLHGSGGLDQPVGQGGFPVVDMGNDRKIADSGKLCHGRGYERERASGQGGIAGFRLQPRIGCGIVTPKG